MWHGRRGCGRAVTWAIPILLTVPGVAVAQRSEGGAVLAQASSPAPAPGGGAEGGTPPSSPAAPSTTPQAPAPPAIPTPPPGTVPGVAPSFPPLVTPSGQALATFTFRPSVGLVEEYTDNFALSARDKQENYRTILNLGLNLLINGARAKGQVNASYGPSYDSSTGDFTGDRSASLLAQIGYEVSPLLHLTVSDALTRSDEPGAADQLSLRRERHEFTTNIASVSADYRLATIATRGYYQFATFVEDQGSNTISHTAGLTATKTFLETNFASLGYEFLRSDTSTGGDVTQHQVTASLVRQLNLFTSAGISGSYAIASVDNGNDFTIGSVNVFTAYTVPGVWSVNASVGYSRFDQSGRGSDSDSITTATNITYHFARATLALGAEAGFSETFQTGQNFGVVETRGVHGSLSYPLTPFVLGTVSGFYRENRFPGGGGSSEPARTEDTWGGTASVSVPLREWLTLLLQYGYTKATSSLPDQDYTENRASVALTATF